MLLTTFPVLELKLTLADNTEVTFRRVPYLHDVFVSEAGHLLRVQQPSQHDHNGRKAFRYGTSTLMTANLVADTYMPGWDAGEGANGHRAVSLHLDSVRHAAQSYHAPSAARRDAPRA